MSIFTVTKRDGTRAPFNLDRVRVALAFATEGLPIDPVEFEAEAAIEWHDGIGVDAIQASLIDTALKHLTPTDLAWDSMAARLLLYDVYNRARVTRQLPEIGYGDYPALVHRLVAEGPYDAVLTELYSDAELAEAGSWIVPDRDHLFRYAGLKLLVDRYVVRTVSRAIAELPQEVFLGIALTLAQAEASDRRLEWAHQFYAVLSQLDVTMATPTFANARRPGGQLSSCFIDTVPDSLEGIYHSVTTFARVSKSGGGMGAYIGKIRGPKAPIRGVPNVAKGVIPWARLFSDTAVAVDQLGQRSGAITCWLDLWYPDVFDFLDAKTPQGDERRKARDIFPGLCIPDAFMEAVAADAEWHLFDPYVVEQHLGFRLEDAYDAEWRRRYAACIAAADLPRRTIAAKELWRAILRSLTMSGTPFLLFRDTVNRFNPNRHAGMIYSSNLCTEIAQNQSASIPAEPVATPEDTVVQTTQPGDLVVCNLASLHLGHIQHPTDLDRIVPIVVRMLDDVITINHLPIPQATRTNGTYRAIGLGVHGYQQYLVARHIPWESAAHVEEADKLFERIAYHAIAASSQLAAERGSYAHFAGSDWQTGTYFSQRGYTSPTWQALAATVVRQGLRNGYLLAIAPTASTSILADATPGIDPVYQHLWEEDKKGYVVQRIAPGITAATAPQYPTAFAVDQAWSLRAAGARQRHLDQSQSLNLYRTADMDGAQLSDWYQLAWRLGVKTVYYFHNQDPEDAAGPLGEPAASTPAPAPHPTLIPCTGCEL